MTNPELGTIETARGKANLTTSLVLRNLSFTIVVPGLGGVYQPWLILTQHGGSLRPGLVRRRRSAARCSSAVASVMLFDISSPQRCL